MYKYGNIFDLNSDTINIHDLNKFNNVRKNRIDFNDLSPQLQVLGNVDPNNRELYVENGISTNEENYMKEVLKGTVTSQVFTVSTNDVIYLQNKEQNYFTLDVVLDGSALVGQFPRINFIEFNLNGVTIESISNINNLLINWDVDFILNSVSITSADYDITPSDTGVITLFTIKYTEPSESWNRRVSIENLFVKSYLLDHVVLTNRTLVVPAITGGDTYSFAALDYLASTNYVNDNTRIKPVNHSQQDNMFIIFAVDNVVPQPGDTVFVVDDHLFGETERFRLRNYLCGWYTFTEQNLNSTKYIAVYIDYNSEYGNTIADVDYKYKYYSSQDDTVYDLESTEGNTFKALGYGTVGSPMLLTKSNVSVIYEEINGQNIYDLLVGYL